MFVVFESFSRCKGTGIFCCLQTFFCFFGRVVATGGGYRDRGGEQVWNLSRGTAKYGRCGDKKGHELLEHIEKPQVPGEGPGVAYGIRAQKERGIGDYLIITF